MQDKNPLRVIERPGEGLALIEPFVRLHTHDLPLRPVLWSQTNGLRKPAPCEICHREIKIGEKAYRPLTNGNDRYCRICPECVEKEGA